MADSSASVRRSVSADGAVHTIILNRPGARNAVDGPTARALEEALLAFDADDKAKVAVLWGDGGCFCAGADLKAFASGDDSKRNPLSEEGTAPMGASRLQLSKPVIAAISGFAVAGGLELAAWCDMRIVEEDAVMGVFCRRWGVPLIDGGTVRLPRLIGESRAMDLILTGRPVSAKEALRIGLANRVVPAGSSRAAAEELAAELAAFPQTCLRADRASVIASAGMSESAAMQQEFMRGLPALAEGAEGAARFASGEGRHGSFKSLSSAPKLAAVVFDLGGVVFSSPFHAIAGYEKELGLPRHALNRVLAIQPAFKKLETGELTATEFMPAFEEDCREMGLHSVSGKAFLSRLNATFKLRPEMVEAIQGVRDAGMKTAVLTNNFLDDGQFDAALAPLRPMLDVVVESRLCGLRKPDPAIYELMRGRLGVQHDQIVFLDDIGRNLKAARKLGWHTIKVAAADEGGRTALSKLQRLIGSQLLAATRRLPKL